MKIERTWRAVLVGAAVVFAAACGQPVTQKPDAGETNKPQEDAGNVEPDAGEPVAQGPDISAQEHYGVFNWSPARALLAGTTTTFVGLQGMSANPSWFGRPVQEDHSEAWLTPGLLALDAATGKVRLYTSADGLPSYQYENPFGVIGTYTESIFDLAWVQKDQSFVAAAWGHVVKGELVNGAWTFSAVRIKAAGQTQFAQCAHITATGGEVFVGCDHGVAVLDPSDLSVKRWVSFGVSMTGPWVAAVSAGKVDGEDAVGIVFGPANAQPSNVALVKPGETNATLFSFNDGSAPLSVLGMDGRMLVGAAAADGVSGSLWAIGAGLSGVTMDVLVGLDVRPGKLAYDAQRGQLIVGAQLTPTGSKGIVQLSATAGGDVTGPAMDLVPQDDAYARVLPWGVDAMAFDDAGRLYLAGQRLCNDHKTRQLPLVRVEWDAQSALRVVMPWLSGVRDLEQDPVNGDTWVAFRDENAGVQCDGLSVGQGICRVRADGACELVPVMTNDGQSLIQPAPGAVDLSFGGADKKELAVVTRDDGTWVRRVETGRQLNTTLDPHMSQDMTAVAWGDRGELWLGSQASWYSDPDLDEEAVNRRRPHGLGYLQVRADATVSLSRRYVRAKSDLTDVVEIEGLPSDTVWAVLPTGGFREALVALGVERALDVYDHTLGDAAPSNAKGGIALVHDEVITNFLPPSGAAFEDVTALAKSPDGAYFAVDSALGVLALDVEHQTASVWAKPTWTAPERPLSLAVDGKGHVAVGTTQALYVFGADQNATTLFANQELGFVWTLKFIQDGVLVGGCDQGLVRVAVEDAALPSALGPASYAERDLWPLAPPCGGVDGCACQDTSECASGYGCAIDISSGAGTCQLQDPCAVDPGANGCFCDSSQANACNAGLMCDCNFLGCTCVVDPATCANGGCTCAEDFDCPYDWYCNTSAGTCGELQQCDFDCTCSTATGCSPGLTCQSGIGGSSCQ